MELVRPNEPDQPDLHLTRILTLRANPTQLNPTQLNPILHPEGLTRRKIGAGRVQIRFIKYIIVWTLFEVNPTQLDPFLDPEGQPDPFEPKN